MILRRRHGQTPASWGSTSAYPTSLSYRGGKTALAAVRPQPDQGAKFQAERVSLSRHRLNPTAALRDQKAAEATQVLLVHEHHPSQKTARLPTSLVAETPKHTCRPSPGPRWRVSKGTCVAKRLSQLSPPASRPVAGAEQLAPEHSPEGGLLSREVCARGPVSGTLQAGLCSEGGLPSGGHRRAACTPGH